MLSSCFKSIPIGVLYHSHAEKHFSVFWQRLEEDESVRESVKGALTSSSSTVVTKAIVGRRLREI